MTEEIFIEQLREEVFTSSEPELIAMSTIFKELEEWDSLVTLSLIAHFDMNLGKKLSGDQIRRSLTIKDLWEIATED
jgi:acyl carrier protein